MTERIVRTSRAAARAAAPAPVQPATPLRQARRTVLASAVPGARATTTSAHMGRSTSNETSQDEVLPATRFGPGEEPAFVRVAHGKTINTGDFSSVRIDVSVTLPCLPEDVEAAFIEASNFVVEKMEQEESYLLGALAPRSRTANRRG